MKYLLSVTALLLIAANVAAHFMGGLGPIPGREMPLARLGIHHHAQMAVLLLLTLMAQGPRDRLYPALTALAALVTGYFIAQLDPLRFTPSGFNNFYVPLLWGLTALCAASAASRAVPPPEERPRLGRFKNMVWLIVALNGGLLAFFVYARPAADSVYQSNILTTAFFVVLPGWLLIACGRWANMSFIAGLAAAVPALTAALALTGHFPPSLDRFTEVYAFCEGFQMTLVCVLAGLICLISLALRAGVRLTGRGRRPVRPLARTLGLLPAGALIMGALGLIAWPLSQESLSVASFRGEMKPLAIADLEMLIPAAYEVGPVHYRLPLVGRADGLLMVEKPIRSDEDLEEELRLIDRRLRDRSGSNGYLVADLSGERRRYFGRPAWLVVTANRPPEPVDVPVPAQRLEFELHLFQPGGCLRLTAGFDYDPRSGQDFALFQRDSLDHFMDAAEDLNLNYRWVGPGRAGSGAFRTLHGVFERPVEGLRLTAMAGPASVEADRPRDFSRDALVIRRGWRAESAYPTVAVTGWPRIDTPIAYYQGFRVNHSRPLTLAGLAGTLETRYFSGSPVSPGLSGYSGLVLSWSGSGRDRQPLEISFTSSIISRNPIRAGLPAAALGQWEEIITSLRLADPPADEPDQTGTGEEGGDPFPGIEDQTTEPDEDEPTIYPWESGAEDAEPSEDPEDGPDEAAGGDPAPLEDHQSTEPEEL